MADEQETNRLLREMHGTIMALDERSKSILIQAEKTNGRVNKLETEHDHLAAKVGSIEGDQKGLMVKMGAVIGGALIFLDVVVRKTLF